MYTSYMSPYLAISVLAIMLASLSGKLFTWRILETWLAPRLHYLVAFAAGVFVIVISQLLEESIHGGVSIEAGVAFLLGAVLLEGMTRVLPKETHHHHGPHADHAHGTLDARRMLVGDAIHNVHDGLTLVPAFLVSPVVGLTTAAGVLVHEMVQEISEFFVLRQAGYSIRKALVLNFLTSATILIGVVTSTLLASVEELAHLLIPFAAGGFLYVVIRDLAPSIFRHARAERRYMQYAAAFAIGLFIMLAVTLIAPHGHEEEEEFLVPEGFGIAMR
jgi:zinc and cadmium transporter